MSTKPSPIATAIQSKHDREEVQRCFGTFAGDMPDPRFRLNVMRVRHPDPFPMHTHEYDELVIVLAGSATHRTDYEDYPIARGDVFVISGDRRHGFDDPRGLELCNIQFDPRQMFSGQRELQQMLGFQGLFDLEPRPPAGPNTRFRQRLTLSVSELKRARSMIDTMIDEFEGEADGRETIVRCELLRLATWLSRVYAERKGGCDSATVRMARTVAHMRSSLSEPMRVESLAEIAGLSPSQFQRVFRSVYGTPVQRYVHQLRIDEACELLAHDPRDIAAIAAATGFSTAALFSTRFKAATGKSPTAYRRSRGLGSTDTPGARRAS